MNLQQEYYKNIMETLRNAEALSLDMLDRRLKQFNKRSYESGVKGVELIGEQPTESLEKKIQESLSQLADIIEQRKNKEAGSAELFELDNGKQSANSHKNKSFNELLLCDESIKDIITLKITEIFTDAKPKHIAHALYALNEIGYIRFGKGDKESVYRVCLNTFGYKGKQDDAAYSALSKAVGYYTNSSDSKIDSELIEQYLEFFEIDN